jgi:hypothetical protein
LNFSAVRRKGFIPKTTCDRLTFHRRKSLSSSVFIGKTVDQRGVS